MRIFLYRMTVDDGGAPCVDADLLSLTICKPQIRAGASPGDLIYAFGSATIGTPDRLIYIAQVSQRVTGGAYFERPEFTGRSDCIYPRRAGAFVLRPNACHHWSDEYRQRDLGPAPGYPNAIALLCRDFRYFGREDMSEWRSRFPLLAQVVRTKLKRGHLTNFSPEVQAELLALKEMVWQAYHERVIAEPTQSGVTACNPRRECGGGTEEPNIERPKRTRCR